MGWIDRGQAERACAARHRPIRESKGIIRELQDSPFTLRELHCSAVVQAVALVRPALLVAFIGLFGTNDSLGLGDSDG